MKAPRLPRKTRMTLGYLLGIGAGIGLVGLALYAGRPNHVDMQALDPEMAAIRGQLQDLAAELRKPDIGEQP